MKKILWLVFLLFCIPNFSQTAYADTAYVIIGEDAWLFDAETEQPIFILPSSYYALLIGIDEKYYHIEFNGVQGKVLRDNVSVTGYEGEAVGTRESIGFSQEYSCFVSVKMQSFPDKKDIVGEIKTDENFEFIGKFPTESGTWYYVKKGEIYGYIPSYICNKEVAEGSFSPSGKTEEVAEESKMDELTKVLVITACITVVVIILVVIFVPRKGKKKRYYYES